MNGLQNIAYLIFVCIYEIDLYDNKLETVLDLKNQRRLWNSLQIFIRVI